MIVLKQDVPSRNSDAPSVPGRPGRPRSQQAHRAILDAARDLLVDEGFANLHLEHVAARAGVGKATIYRRWADKEALVGEVLRELASPHISVRESGDTRDEFLAVVMNAVSGLTQTPFGPVIRALLSQIAMNPALGDPFRASVVQSRRDEVARVVRRGIERGDLHPDVDAGVATELLVGPVYFRLMFGGRLDRRFAGRIVDAVLHGYASRAGGGAPDG